MSNSIDPISPTQPTTPPFETAAMQVALAKAQAAAAKTNPADFLKAAAKTNAETNEHALDGTQTTAPSNATASNTLLNLDPSLSPSINPSPLSLLNEVGTNVVPPAGHDGFTTQQLHDIAVLQKDAAQLAEAASQPGHIPLGTSASTVDLSVVAQNIINGKNTVASIGVTTSPTAEQLAQIAAAVQPVANAPLTPELLQQVQTQLSTEQNPIQLSLNTIYLAMNLIAATQVNPTHEIDNTATQIDTEAVAPVAAIPDIAIEGSTIHS